MSISRRGFLKGAAVGTLAASTAKAAGGKHFTGYPGRNGLLHDTTLCVGCRSCEVACAAVNDNPVPKAEIGNKDIFDKIRRTTENDYTVVNRYKKAEGNKPAVYRKHQCMHCNEPCCASVCFVDAFTKTPEGPVLYDPEVCVGCRYCVFACPYYALAYEYDDPLTPRVVRCTMCYPRIKEGLNPACADACPTGAIVYGKRKDLIQLAHERIRKYPERYINHIFGEHEWGGTSWLTLSGTELVEMGLPDNPGPEPLPNLTTGFLSLAPLVAALFPGLLAGVYAFSKRKDNLSQVEKDSLLEGAKTAADRQLKDELAAAEKKAQRDQEYAINLAVKDALREAQKAATEADGPSKEEPK